MEKFNHTALDIEHIRILLENFGSIIYQLDVSSGHITCIFGSIKEATGYSNKEILSGKIDWKSIIYPEDLPYVISEIEKVCTSRGYKSDINYRIICSDGHLLWVNDRGILIQSEEGRHIMHGSITDISKIRESEMILRGIDIEKSLLLNTLSESIIYIDNNFRIKWANLKALEYISEDVSEIIGTYCYFAFYKRDKYCVSCPVRSTLRSGKSNSAIFKTPDKRHISISSTPVLNHKGDMSGALAVSFDITKEIEATQKSLEINKMMQTALDASEIGLLDIDVPNRLITYSPSFLKLVSKKNLRPRLADLLRIIHTDDRESFSRSLEEQFNRQDQESLFESEFRLRIKPGRHKHKWILLRGVVFSRDADGYPLRIIAGAVDITKIKMDKIYLDLIHEIAINLPNFSTLKGSFDFMLEKMLKLEEVDCGGAYIVEQDTKALRLVAHKGLSDDFIEEVIYYSQDSLNARLLKKEPIYAIFNEVHQKMDEKVGAEEGLRAIAIIPVLNDDRIIAVMNIASRSSDYFSHQTRSLLESISGQVGSIMLSIISKTHFERSSSILKATLESSGDGIIVVDHQGRITMYNNSFKNMWKIPDSIMHSGSIQAVTEYISGKVINHEEFYARIKHIKANLKNKSYDIIELNNSQFFERYSQPQYMEGKIAGRVWNYRNITERVLREKEQEQLKLQLAHSQKMESLGRLSSSIAHDLNNLLSPILGYSEILLSKLSDIERKELRSSLKIIYDTAIRARDLTKKLLELGRKQEPDTRPININQIISSFVPILRKTIRDGIDLILELEEDIPPIKADIAQIEHVLLNLAINASDAIETNDRGQIFIRTYKSHINSICLEFADTGRGITNEIKERLFEPFFTTKKNGSGLGLTIVYNIIRQHKGDIFIESSPGKGTAFYILLPATAEKLDRKPYSELIEEEELFGSETILLVEDNKNIRDLLNQILKQYKYNVITASDAQQAIKSARSFRGEIHLLFTDFSIPGMSGKDIYNSIKGFRPDIRVLYMSGYGDRIIQEKFKDEITGNFLQKPFSVLSVAKKLRNILS